MGYRVSLTPRLKPAIENYRRSFLKHLVVMEPEECRKPANKNSEKRESQAYSKRKA